MILGKLWKPKTFLLRFNEKFKFLGEAVFLFTLYEIPSNNKLIYRLNAIITGILQIRQSLRRILSSRSIRSDEAGASRNSDTYDGVGARGMFWDLSNFSRITHRWTRVACA